MSAVKQNPLEKSNGRMFHVYYIKQDAKSGKKNQHGFYFVSDTAQTALQEFLVYAEAELGETLSDSQVTVQEVLEDTVITRDKGRVTISCS